MCYTMSSSSSSRYVQEMVESWPGIARVPAEYVSRADPGTEPHHNTAAVLPALDMLAYRRHPSPDHHHPPPPPRHCFLSRLRHACSQWGAFHLLNHGIPDELLARVRLVQRRFFQLPAPLKRAYANDVPSGSYEGYGSLLGQGPAPRDWRDYLYLTVLPRPSLWPSHPTSFRETIEEFSKEVVHVWRTLMRALGESLGISRFAETFGDLDMSIAMNYYPICPQPELTLGLSPHSDVGGITILLQDEHVPGLQVKTPIGTWMTIQPIPNALLINLGDQLEILTNGLYRSMEHRVLVNSVSPRLSLGCFMNPSNDTVVAPLQELVGEENPPNYEPMTFKQYRSMIRRAGINGKSYIKSRVNNHEFKL